jgi:putative salt-induced outer membrane protein YdiY
VKLNTIVFAALLIHVSLPEILLSQSPAKVYAGNFGAGFALTGGNSDTKSYNLTFEVTRDPKTKNLMKADGLYLRSSANDRTNTDLLRLNYRDDYLLTKRITVYGALGYLRNPFKNILFLLNPQGGIGFKAYSSDRMTFSLSAGAGIAWEKDEGLKMHARGTLNASQSFSYKLLGTSKLTENFTVMRKTQELLDVLYHFDIGFVTSVARRIDVKFEFMDGYKNRTPSATIKKNDTALIASVLYTI